MASYGPPKIQLHSFGRKETMKPFFQLCSRIFSQTLFVMRAFSHAHAHAHMHKLLRTHSTYLQACTHTHTHSHTHAHTNTHAETQKPKILSTWCDETNICSQVYHKMKVTSDRV